MENIEVPENFQSVIRDFTCDLTVTFPEYAHLWQKWTTDNVDIDEIKALVYHVSQIFPERFFDILYQNEDIFDVSNKNEIRTDFLPNVDFRVLFNTTGVSETTKNAIWKYLQLILVNILGTVKSKGDFGSTANLFEGIDENALHEKLAETMESVSDFFHNLGGGLDGDNNPFSGDYTDDTNESSEENENDGNSGSSTENGKTNGQHGSNGAKNMPNAEYLHDHLNGLFNGKIGSLAKELAEEISHDMQHLFEDEGSAVPGENGVKSDVRTTQDLLKKMIKNPKKIMEIIKTIGTKLNDKMKNGEINEEDIMKEATDILGKMKGMGGKKEMAQFTDLFKTIGKSMGMDTKNMKMNMGAVNKMQSKFMTKERMMQKLEQRRQAKAQQQQQQENAGGRPYKSSQQSPHPIKNVNYDIKDVKQVSSAKKSMVFSIDGEEKQERTYETGVDGTADDDVGHENEDLDEMARMIESSTNGLGTLSVGGGSSSSSSSAKSGAKKKKKNKK
jgi:hypothetical protein